MPFQKRHEPLSIKLATAPHWLSETDLLFQGQRIGQPVSVTHAKSPLKVSLLIDKQTSLHKTDGMCQRARVKEKGVGVGWRGGLKNNQAELKNISWIDDFFYFFLFYLCYGD